MYRSCYVKHFEIASPLSWDTMIFVISEEFQTNLKMKIETNVSMYMHNTNQCINVYT